MAENCLDERMNCDYERLVDTEAFESKTSMKRWLILALFWCVSFLSGFQWIQFVNLPEIFTDFYGVTENALAWTSMIYLAVFMLLAFPSMAITEYLGLRRTSILASFLNAVGAGMRSY